MHRKAYVSGIAALLAALLAGCTGSSDNGGSTDDSNPGDAGTASAAARPGKYTTLPEACSAVGRPTLDSLLPGIAQLIDDKQRETAYDGEATLTFDTDRKVGCRWKVQSADATDHLFVDLERVVSYDNSVSDDDEAEELFARKVTAADIPQPAASESGTGSPSGTASSSSSTPPSPPSSPSSSPSASGSGSAGASPSSTPTDLQPRLLDDLGDEAFVNDVLSSSGSTVKQRTVTVAFRTSNVIVTIEYEEQPATVGPVPDSKEMQDKARKLASRLADSLAG
ncbi:hypothetical protein [Streptomyces sp. DSM 15324]|uniref:hypothetical protein n=1 Tax=Streptomyces sp. DSM 15324 TaxID=1739111 RepID=UPI00074B0E2E|nr:hypothetical protein [Streptomyces sp. DSM 15324]KUO11582.1 hypothetical protein AQJ58_14255 [Streptomyces sp. DSM 15324]